MKFAHCAKTMCDEIHGIGYGIGIKPHSIPAHIYFFFSLVPNDQFGLVALLRLKRLLSGQNNAGFVHSIEFSLIMLRRAGIILQNRDFGLNETFTI